MLSLLEKPEKKSSRFPVVIFLVFGLALVLFYLYDIVSAYAELKWPTVIGQVIQSSIRVVKDKGTAYCPDISWTYHVEGRIYSGSNDPFCESNAHAQAVVRKFPVGASVVISYSPQDASVSTIEPGTPRMPVIILIIGVIFIIAAIYNL